MISRITLSGRHGYPSVAATLAFVAAYGAVQCGGFGAGLIFRKAERLSGQYTK
jgi:hypothetical protein